MMIIKKPRLGGVVTKQYDVSLFLAGYPGSGTLSVEVSGTGATELSAYRDAKRNVKSLILGRLEFDLRLARQPCR